MPEHSANDYLGMPRWQSSFATYLPTSSSSSSCSCLKTISLFHQSELQREANKMSQSKHFYLLES